MERPYRVEASPKATRSLRRLARKDRPGYKRVLGLLRSLAEDPLPRGSGKMRRQDAWRVRTGDYRAIYLVHDAERVVTVLDVGNRREIYGKGA